MKTLKIILYAGFLLVMITCSHNPYNDFQKIQIGDDKETVLTKAGSPIRSHFKEGKDIWTYRFYIDEQMIYKNVILEKQKVVDIKESQELEIKEKKIEEDLKELKKSKESDSKFAPVE